MVLVCHVILQDHVIKGLSNFMGISQSKKLTMLPGFVAVNTVVLVC